MCSYQWTCVLTQREGPNYSLTKWDKSLKLLNLSVLTCEEPRTLTGFLGTSLSLGFVCVCLFVSPV